MSVAVLPLHKAVGLVIAKVEIYTARVMVLLFWQPVWVLVPTAI